MNAHASLPTDGAAWKLRRPKRLPAPLAIRLRTAEGASFQVRLVDFSRRGFGVESRRTVLIGSIVELDLPGLGWVAAEIRWNIGSRTGGRFVEEIARGATSHLPCDENDDEAEDAPQSG